MEYVRPTVLTDALEALATFSDAKFIHLVRDPAQRARLGDAATRRARRFYFEAKTTLTRLYSRLLEERDRRAAAETR